MRWVGETPKNSQNFLSMGFFTPQERGHSFLSFRTTQGGGVELEMDISSLKYFLVSRVLKISSLRGCLIFLGFLGLASIKYFSSSQVFDIPC